MDVKKYLRMVSASAWVGWQVESNWTEPLIFIGLQVIRPLASTLLFPLLYVVGMSFVGGKTDPSYLTYIVIGTVFFIPYISAAETAGQVISQDRERYGVLKSIYITEASLTPYLLGRFAAVVCTALISTTSSLIIAYATFMYVFNLPLTMTSINFFQLSTAVIAVLIGSAALFYLLPSVNLHTNKLHWSLAYYVLGFLYLTGDIIFPVSSLTHYATFLTYIIPVNQALNMLRAAFGLPIESNVYLTLTTPAGWLAFSMVVFNLSVKQARRKALLDRIGWW
ncbi:MAG: hypothetical protein QW614_04690 [Candidatus Caldarchaeum sp.]|uniref:Uncharacterized protein n=1 Tax=Caldiarchaeum subterraneum TaxID=311458 RepID=A0A7C5LE93_CALS0